VARYGDRRTACRRCIRRNRIGHDAGRHTLFAVVPSEAIGIPAKGSPLPSLALFPSSIGCAVGAMVPIVGSWPMSIP
jgi:hypothetical protein